MWMKRKTNRTICIKELMMFGISHYYYFLLFLLVSLISCFTYVNYLHVPTYMSKGKFIINTSVNTLILNTAEEMIFSNEFLDIVAESLNSLEDHLHSPTWITKQDLSDGISVYITAYSPTVVVSYTSGSKNSNHIVLNEVLKKAVSYGNETRTVFRDSLSVGALSDSSTYAGVPIPIIYFTFICFGFVLSLVSLFFIPLFGTKVYFLSEYENVYSNKSKFKNSRLKKSKPVKGKVLALQNDLDAQFAHKKLKHFAFIAEKNDENINTTILGFVENNTEEGLHTLVIDLDFFSDSLHKIMCVDTNQKVLFPLGFSNKNLHVNALSERVHYLCSDKIKMYGRFLKDEHIESFLKTVILEYDSVLIKLGSFDTFLLLKTLIEIDTLIACVEIGKSKRSFIDNVLINSQKINYKNSFIYFL